MGKAMLPKKELIAMLQSISIQLDRLEMSIKTKLSQKQIDWTREQNLLIDRCEERLKQLERNVTTIEEKEAAQAKKALKASQSYKQELYTF